MPSRELIEAARKVWDTIPATYNEKDISVIEHAKALNEMHAVLTRAEAEHPASGPTLKEAIEAARVDGWRLDRLYQYSDGAFMVQATNSITGRKAERIIKKMPDAASWLLGLAKGGA